MLRRFFKNNLITIKIKVMQTKSKIYKGVEITRLFPSGYYELYSYKKGRFLKFDTLLGAKRCIDAEDED